MGLSDSLGGKSAQYGQAPVPKDLQGFRTGQIDFLNSLFGGGGSGGAGLEQMFGQLGNPATPLQRQSTAGISQFLNQPAPEQRALDMSIPALQAILGGKPGQGIMDALQPKFQQNLAMADQQGGRFGSANAILRSQAVNDYNLLGAQAAQQGQQTQLQAADALRMLSGQAGQNPFQRLMGASQVGANDATQADTETQRRIQLLGFLMAGGQQAAFGQPYVQYKGAQGSFLQGMGNFLASIMGNQGGGNPFGGSGGGGSTYNVPGQNQGGPSPEAIASLFG
jgi:hypothetical protein